MKKMFSQNVTKFVSLADIKKFCIDLESVFSDFFCKMLRRQNLSRKTVIEKQETVMEKSLGKISKLCWNPGS